MNKVFWGICITFFVVVLIFEIGSCCAVNEYHNLTVTDKSYSGETDGYIVWMESPSGQQYEFKNADSFIDFKWDSGTVQGQLKVGNTYNVKTRGWRVPFVSKYPNIIEYDCVAVGDE